MDLCPGRNQWCWQACHSQPSLPIGPIDTFTTSRIWASFQPKSMLAFSSWPNGPKDTIATEFQVLNPKAWNTFNILHRNCIIVPSYSLKLKGCKMYINLHKPQLQSTWHHTWNNSAKKNSFIEKWCSSFAFEMEMEMAYFIVKI